jgi:hypothetical protein
LIAASWSPRRIHLEAATPLARLAEASHANARLKLTLLLARKVKESQRELSAAVTDPDQQVAAAAKRRLGQKHLTRYETPGTSNQSTEPDQLGAILVAQRQQKQQVLDPAQVQAPEFFRHCRPDTGKGCQRRFKWFNLLIGCGDAFSRHGSLRCALLPRKTSPTAAPGCSIFRWSRQ